MTEYLTRMARDRELPPRALGVLDFPATQQLARVVLLVDDDSEIRAAHSRALAEELGEAVVLARNGCEALARARRHRPAVVLLDVGRPSLDGFALGAALRADPATANAWLIALTATGIPREASRAGFDQLLWKPVDAEHLCLAVQAGLVRAAATRGGVRL